VMYVIVLLNLVGSSTVYSVYSVSRI